MIHAQLKNLSSRHSSATASDNRQCLQKYPMHRVGMTTAGLSPVMRMRLNVIRLDNPNREIDLRDIENAADNGNHRAVEDATPSASTPHSEASSDVV